MLERWKPWSDVDRLWNDLDRAFWDRAARGRVVPRSWGYQPAFDVYDAGDHLIVKAAIPGARPADVNVSLEQNTVTIQGSYGYVLPEEQARNIHWYRQEIGHGQFSESFTLPIPVDADQVDATFEHGLLTLSLPKAEQARVKKIPIQVRDADSGSES
jgi:HSP20 family protein